MVDLRFWKSKEISIEEEVAKAFAEKKPASKEKPSFGESAEADITQYVGYNWDSYNPDKLVEDKGEGLYLYQRMMTDADVKAAVLHKIYAAINPGWIIQPANKDNSKDQKIAKALQWNLEGGLGGNVIGQDFDEALVDIARAVIDGYSITEAIWRYIDSGPYKGFIGYKCFKGKNPDYMWFNMDKYKNITRIVLNLNNGTDIRSLDPKKFIIFPYMKQYSDPHGRSDLNAVYRYWWLKKTAYQLRAVYHGRFALGVYVIVRAIQDTE